MGNGGVLISAWNFSLHSYLLFIFRSVFPHWDLVLATILMTQVKAERLVRFEIIKIVSIVSEICTSLYGSYRCDIQGEIIRTNYS